MNEIEWLKQESGLTDDDIKGLEAVGGFTKLRTGLMKVLGLSEQALKDKVEAENARIGFEQRYQNEFVPEMRKVTQDALKATGEAARLKAELEQARQYGIVPEPSQNTVVEPPRAPGSPDPNSITRDDFGRFSQSQANTIVALQDLSAEHFGLFGKPLGNTQELIDEVTRQRTLGNKQFTLKQAWETKHNVIGKREEMTKAERQKEIDAAVAADRKSRAESGGTNPNMRSGVPSRFSTYKATDSGKEPWKAPHSKSQSNKEWRESSISKIREAMAS
jgi:hypothetical protein